MRHVSERDWGLLYGYGLFETVRAYEGVPFMLDEHIKRMLTSAEQLGFENPPSRQTLMRRTREFCRSLGDRVIRVTLTAGNPDMGMRPRFVVTDRAIPYGAATVDSGIAVTIAASTRDENSLLLHHKTLNQIQNVLAWRDALRKGCGESLFFNGTTHLAEGSRSNVFIVKDGEILTPAERCGILPGITRRTVIGLLRQAGMHVREELITFHELFACDECFLTNAVMEVLPVNRIDGHALPRPLPGPVTRAAAVAYGEAVGRTIEVADRINSLRKGS